MTTSTREIRIVARIAELWWSLRESSPRGARQRRRLLAPTALAVFIGGFLAAAGLGRLIMVLAMVVLALLAAAVAIVLLVLLARTRVESTARIWSRRGVAADRLAGATARGLQLVVVRLGAGRNRTQLGCETAIRATRSYAPMLAAAGSNELRIAARRASLLPHQALRSLGPVVAGVLQAAARDKGVRHSRVRQSVQWKREGLRLNAAGVQLRRQGAYAEAVERHRAALAIFRRLGDRGAEALTLNNLALALSRAGDDAEAIGLFEEAAAILRVLGEREHEGKVIANLALAHGRQGRRQQSADALQAALAKLNPASSAYQTVEAELRRAS